MNYTLSNPSASLFRPLPYLAGAILFGFVGFTAYRYERIPSEHEMDRNRALMVYPYAVSETWLMYAVGLGFARGCIGVANRTPDFRFRPKPAVAICAQYRTFDPE
jgi:hypothetical protein